ncbi:MAG: hypothetical protein WCF90_01405 [Methanomicrobiales archaeon]
MSDPATNDRPIIQRVDVSKVYHVNSGDFTALDHVFFSIEEIEFIAIVGPSG